MAIINWAVRNKPMHMNNLQGKECAGDYLFLPAAEVKTVSVLGSTSELEQL